MSATLFVAAEVGFWNNPKTLTFARTVRKPDAGSMILRLREFFLLHGQGGVLPRNFDAEDIATGVGWNGKPHIVVNALVRIGVLQRRRGRWIYPGWADTVTGFWEEKKLKDRSRKERERELKADWKDAFPGDPWPGVEEAERRLSGADGPGSVRGPSADEDRTNPDKASNQGPAGAGRQAPSAPERGGAARWGWMLENHPRPEDPAACTRILGGLTEAEWELVKFAVPHLARIHGWNTPSRIKKCPNSRAFLERSVWLQARKAYLKSLEPEAAEKAPDPEAVRKHEAQSRELEEANERRVAEMKMFSEVKKLMTAKGLTGQELLDAIDAEMERRRASAAPRLEVVR